MRSIMPICAGLVMMNVLANASANISIIELDPSRYQEYRELTLHALKNNPEAFGTVYEDECNLPDEYWKQQLLEAAEGKKYIVFAQKEEKLIGMATAMITSTGAYLRHSARLNRVYVMPNERGQHIGHDLVKKLLDILKEQQSITQAFLYVNQNEEPAIALYERFGFQKKGVFSRLFKVNNEYYDAYLMICVLR